MKSQQLTAYAFSAQSFMRFVNDLSHALAMNHEQVLSHIKVNSVELSRGEKIAVINYSLPLEERSQEPGIYRNIDSERFVWPSQLTLAARTAGMSTTGKSATVH